MMDAKPHRPLRTLKIHDENQNTQSQHFKTIHQRNKSSPALSSLAQTGGTKLISKRTAFADVSNVSRPLASIKDDSALSLKLEQDAAKGKTGSLDSTHTAHLQRPAHRPVSVTTLKGFFSTLGATSTQSTTTKTAVADILLPAKALSKKTTNTLWKSDVPGIEVAVAPLAAVHKPNARRNTTAAAPVVFTTKGDDRPQSSSSALFHDARSENPPSEVSNLTKESEEKDAVKCLAMPEEPQIPSYVEPEQPLATDVASKPDFADDLERSHLRREGGRRSGVSESWDCIDEDDEDDYTTMRSLRSRGDFTSGQPTVVLAPKVTGKAELELADAKKHVQSCKDTAELQEDEAWDTSMVAEYGEDIFRYLHELENRMLPNAYYMDNQTEVQWSMRAVLMDWLVQVHHRFGLLPETLFLTVNYIDRFLSCKVVSLGKLQLVGATAIFVAAKYEEINCPSVNEIVYMVDNGYTPDEILKAERFMLTMLQFELGWPGPMSFLRRISKADDYDLETRTLAKYFLEITIMDERFVGTPPSFTAAASHCLARLMLQKGSWSQKHVYYSGYTFPQLQPCLSTLLSCCEDPQKHHAAVFEKYQDKRFKRAAVFVREQMALGFRLPLNSCSSMTDDMEKVMSAEMPALVPSLAV